jgi:hypothetical protein
MHTLLEYFGRFIIGWWIGWWIGIGISILINKYRDYKYGS